MVCVTSRCIAYAALRSSLLDAEHALPPTFVQAIRMHIWLRSDANVKRRQVKVAFLCLSYTPNALITCTFGLGVCRAAHTFDCALLALNSNVKYSDGDSDSRLRFTR